MCDIKDTNNVLWPPLHVRAIISLNFGHFMLPSHKNRQVRSSLKAGFHLQQTERPQHHKQSDYAVEQVSITLIGLFWLEISGCHGRNWLYGYQGLGPILVSLADRRELIRSLLISYCFNKKFASSLLFLVSWSTEQVEVESTDFFPETT